MSLLHLSSALPRLLQLSGRLSTRLVSHSYAACALNGALVAGLVVATWSVISDDGTLGEIPTWLRIVFVAAVAQ